MTRFLTADLHIGHEVVAKKRGFKSAHKHDKALLHAYNDLVTDDDEVYIVGDLCMWGPEKRVQLDELVQKMKGRKHLILGNHDRFKPFVYVEAGITAVHTSLWIDMNVGAPFYLVHDPSAAATDIHNKWVCGHIHNLFKQIGMVLNIGVDVWDLKPVPAESMLMAFIGARPTETQKQMRELAGKLRHSEERIDKEDGNATA